MAANTSRISRSPSSTTRLQARAAYIAVTDRLELAPFVVGVMLGLFSAGVNINSNQADLPYDREAARGTLAVHIGARWNRRVAVLILALGWLFFALALWTRSLPAAAAAAAPLVILHMIQLRLLFASDPIAARNMGFTAFRLLFAALCVVWLAPP
jgi:1,4-dihydroxy-2-naphthoate octaprenyltransferase